MRADNISAIVIILDAVTDLEPVPLPAASRSCRPADLLWRTQLRRRRRHGLRTVLGKICRLRAQRSPLGMMRPPLGNCNRLSVARKRPDRDARPAADRMVSVRQLLRRRSYREACVSGGASASDGEQVVACRPSVSVDCGHLSDDMSGAASDLESSPRSSAVRVASSPPQEKLDDLTPRKFEEVQITGARLGTVGDNSVEASFQDASRFRSTVDLRSPSLTTDLVFSS